MPVIGCSEQSRAFYHPTVFGIVKPEPYSLWGMMRILTVLAIGCAVLCCAAMPLLAQGSGIDSVPAETPPAGYSANFYVDSRGCMFVRARTTARITWIPRVTRRRELMCGFEPSLAVATLSNSKTAVSTLASAVSASPTVVSGPILVPLARKPVPTKFQAAWTDGRLNPLRGPRTSHGDAQMALVWTDTVPMIRKVADVFE